MEPGGVREIPLSKGKVALVDAAQADRFGRLSDDAKCIAGGQFGLLIHPGKGSVTYQTPWNRTPRAIAAYAELVEAGVLSEEYGTEGMFALTYRALVRCDAAWKWFSENTDKGAWPMMVTDAERRERPPRGWQAA